MLVSAGTVLVQSVADVVFLRASPLVEGASLLVIRILVWCFSWFLVGGVALGVVSGHFLSSFCLPFVKEQFRRPALAR